MKRESQDIARARIPIRRGRSLEDLIADQLIRMDHMAKNPRPISGYSTGLGNLDALTGGLHAGQLAVVAGYPSTGRTAFCLNVATHLFATGEYPVVIFALTLTASEAALKILSAVTGVAQQRIRNGCLGNAEHEKVNETSVALRKAPVFIYDSPHLNLSDVLACTDLIQRQYGRVAVAVVDGIESLADRERVNPYADSEMPLSRSLKEIALDLRVPVLVTAELTRGRGDSPSLDPTIGGLDAALASNADAVFLTKRAWSASATDPKPWADRIVVAKNSMGPEGEAMLIFTPEIASWRQTKPSDSECGRPK